MRLFRGVPLVSALATPATVGTAPAYAQDAIAPSAGVPQNGSALVAHHSSAPSDGWLIGAGVGGGVALIGAGVASSRRTSRRTTTARQMRVPSES